MRILFLSPRQCWPARSGAKLREYHFLRALAQHSEVTYLHFTDPGVSPLTRDDLPFCREVAAVPKPRPYGPGKLIQGLTGRWPLPILNYASEEMSAAVARVTNATRFDLIHLDSIHMIRYGNALSRAKIVYGWHNIESEYMRRYSATASSAARRWYAAQTIAKLERLEREILETAIGHVVCSDREAAQLLQIAPQARIAVIHNGVDVEYFAGASAGNAASRNVIFVGAMDYPPNAEAAVFFSRRIWPTVRERMPDARLWIVGASPAPAIVALGELPGVTVTGTVPDVRPYYRDALAAIVPLRTGGGTRLKILEAMAAGVPVVSTPLGAEGLDVAPGRDILLADPDDAETWSALLLRLADPADGPRRALAAAGLDLVRAHYDWGGLGEALWEKYRGWLEPRA